MKLLLTIMALLTGLNLFGASGGGGITGGGTGGAAGGSVTNIQAGSGISITPGNPTVIAQDGTLDTIVARQAADTGTSNGVITLVTATSNALAFAVHDISTNMALKGTVALSGWSAIDFLTVMGDTVFICNSAANQMRAISCTNPELPVIVSTTALPFQATTAYWITKHESEPYVYLSGYGNTVSLAAYNVKDPANPVLTWTYTMGGTNTPRKIQANEGYLMVSSEVGSQAGKIYTFNLTNAAIPSLVSTFTCPCGGDVIKRKNTVYVADYTGRTLRAVNYTDPANPVQVHVQATAEHGNHAASGGFEPWKLDTKGEALFLSDDNTLQIFNVANATNPVFANAIQIGKDVEGSQIVGDVYVFGSSGIAGDIPAFYTFDITDPFNPSFIFRTNHNIFSVHWFGMDSRYLYYGAGSSFNLYRAPRNSMTEEAPMDGRPYVRIDGRWMVQPTNTFFAITNTGLLDLSLPEILITNNVTFTGITNPPPAGRALYLGAVVFGTGITVSWPALWSPFHSNSQTFTNGQIAIKAFGTNVSISTYNP